MNTTPDELESIKNIVKIIARILEEIISQTDQMPQANRLITHFHASRQPAISIEDYLLRVVKYSGCSGECYLMALIYIDKLSEKNPQFIISSLNIHRLLLTSIMLAAKFHDDHYYNNEYYAKVGGITLREINALEAQFLHLVHWDLCIEADRFMRYKGELLANISPEENGEELMEQ
eukprot:CAMPEP_0114986522 /NCGR_PEP_ID=MMETSP0216-20121206/8472_1 /TAXON_ID=223996 /ORGANISM="Protocruzia adherens, Strain Boccale" /LENGTH=175 /DNA_ID=CAMNT_0002348965 /DNA_START=517 /DNA_END=1044 /DNA_ORIENTATION=-